MSLLSLFCVVTLEDWTDVMYIQMYGCAEDVCDGLERLCTVSKASPILGAHPDGDTITSDKCHDHNHIIENRHCDGSHLFRANGLLRRGECQQQLGTR